MRALLRSGWSALLLILIMSLGSLVLWIGIPLGWLWVASQIQGATGSVGAAIGTAFLGIVVSIAVMAALLTGLSDAYRRQRIARGLDDTGHVALEIVLVLSAAAAIVGFAGWFFLFSGSSPIPVNLSY